MRYFAVRTQNCGAGIKLSLPFLFVLLLVHPAFSVPLIVDGTTVTKGGTETYDYVLIKNGGVVNIDPSSGFWNVTATYNITVDSTSSINGDQRGNNGGSSDVAGPGGNGGGGTGCWLGCYHPGASGGSAGTGAKNTGTPSSYSIELGGNAGSGGAGGHSSGSTWGCCLGCGYAGGGGGGGSLGGAGLRLNAPLIIISGTVTMDGGSGGTGGVGGANGHDSDGQGGGGGGGGGGSAGGTILIDGTTVNITNAQLTATGGGGGSGGAGGYAICTPGQSGNTGLSGDGGRLKVFYTYLNNASAPLTQFQSIYFQGKNIYFIPPTDDDNAIVTRTSSYVNVSVSDATSTTSFIDWNRSLVAWWRFNNEAGESSAFFRDWSSYGNNASCSNCPAYASGKFGSALWFDGVNDLASVPNSNSLDLGSTFTIEGWFNPNQLFSRYSENYAGLLDKGGYSVFLDKSDGKLKFASSGGGSWSSLSSGMSSGVYSIVAWNGSLYAGGSFTTAGGVSVNRIARWDGSSWYDVGGGMNGQVNALAVWNGNLYAGGDFTTAGGVSANRIAKWDGSSWSALGSGVGNNYVNSIVVWNNNLYIGGPFTSVGGSSISNIAKWDGSGWSALSTQVFGGVQSLAVFNGSLYAGGSLMQGGTILTRGVIRWDGTSWSDLAGGMNMGATVYSLASYSGKLYAGGTFTTAGGVAASNIARWDGASWSALGSGTGSTVNALAAFDGSLYTGGTFTTAGGISANYIARWDGSSWNAVSSGMNNNVYSLGTFNGSMYAAGWFTFAGGIGANRIVRLDSGARTVASSTSSWNAAWHQFAVTYDGSTLKLYHNGALESTSAASGQVSGGSSPMLLGTTYGNRGSAYGSSSGPEYFYGLLDEVRIHRRALGPEEIAAAYNTRIYKLYHNFTSLSIGNYTYAAYYQNLDGTVSQTETRRLSIVAVQIPPTASISIQSPLNITYTTKTIALSYTTSNAVSCRYELNGVNTSLPSCQNTTITAAEGSNWIRVWANNSANVWNSSATVYFGVDTIPPSISVQSPQNKTYATPTIALNYTVSGAASCKYELNGVNTSIPSCQNTTITAVEGSNSIRVWANDSAGNWNASARVYFGVDTIPPAISIQSPQNITYTTKTISLNYTVSGAASCRYELNGINTSLSNCQDTTITAAEGSNSIRVWANDSAGNWNASARVYFGVDTIPPAISIQSPQNKTYYTTLINVNYTVSGAASCKYELNGANTSLPGCLNASLIGLVNGSNWVRVWANDTAGNWNASATVYFSVDPSGIPPCSGGPCDGFLPGLMIPSCNRIGLSYFQDWCNPACELQDNYTNICRAQNSTGIGDGCTADPDCDNRQIGSCFGSPAVQTCNSDCSYSVCGNNCCDSYQKPFFDQGVCIVSMIPGDPGCRGNNMPTAGSFAGGGTFIPNTQTQLNATLGDDDQLDEEVNLTFYKDPGCTIGLASASCLPGGTMLQCTISPSFTLGPNPEEYAVYYKATDGWLETACGPTGLGIKIHNFTIEADFEEDPMPVNVTGWIYINPISQPEGTMMDTTQIIANSYTIRKGSFTEGPKALMWDPPRKAWVANFTPQENGTYQLSADFTDTYGITNRIDTQFDAGNTLSISLEGAGSMPIIIPIGGSAIFYLDIHNNGNRQRVYNVSLNGDLYQVGFNGASLSGRKWRTTLTAPKHSSARGVLTISGKQLTQGTNEFRIRVKNLATNAESETAAVTYLVVYSDEEGRRFAPDLETTSLLALALLGPGYAIYRLKKRKQ